MLRCISHPGWLLLLPLVLATVPTEAGELDKALASEDECSGEEAEDGSCALSAVQLRAGVLRQKADEAGAAAAAAADGGRASALAGLAARFFDGRVAEVQAGAVGEHLAALRGLAADEVTRYRQRFVAEVSVLQGDTSPSQEQLHQVFLDQEPVVTELLVQRARAGNENWEAGVSEWASNLTVKETKALMGHLEDHTLEEVPKDLGRGDAQPEDASKLPEDFDSRQHWPRCKEVFEHLRDQGKCGSCWAFAAAGTMDGRLCIASNGLFSGDKAWTSASYITSCYPMTVYPHGKIDGCAGGNPGSALEAASKGAFGTGGVPTGNSPGGPLRQLLDHIDGGCVPWFGHGSALDHFLGSNPTAPECPTSCTSSNGYSRPLGQDKFYPTGKVQTTTIFEEMQVSLIQGGPLPFAMKVYRDFMSYKGGYYDKTTDERVGDHSAIVFGYKKHKGRDYILGMNSWGSNWGTGNGIFYMAADCCGITYYLPQIGRQQPALPLPGGPTKGSLADAEDETCIKKTGGTCLFLGCHQSRGPTRCAIGQCECATGYCQEDGKCVRRGTQDLESQSDPWWKTMR